MYSLAEIRQVHLEVTERCNAACPQCPRRIDGGILNPRLTMAELSLDAVKNLLHESFLRQLKKVYLCGNYGDPAAAASTPEIVTYLRAASPQLQIGIHSNGSLRDTHWWQVLAKTIGMNGYARFAIDGLADTNHIYRRNTDWEKIMANARAFMAAGGRAEWDFIVFGHNEHQVEEARALATEMGFQSFYVKRTARFLVRESGKQPPRAVKNFRGENVAVLERPVSTEYQYERQPNPKTIDCKAMREKSLYVSAEGKIFPCCYLGQMIKNPENAETREFREIFPGIESDLAGAELARAIKSRIFSSDTPQQLKICSRACGS